ncbi:hypothetical protein TNCV_4175941 [Trichonephila clavipes]|nr:hypothetical protein TNCV_4175941 [Trichonephila clavipes]
MNAGYQLYVWDRGSKYLKLLQKIEEKLMWYTEAAREVFGEGANRDDNLLSASHQCEYADWIHFISPSIHIGYFVPPRIYKNNMGHE